VRDQGQYLPNAWQSVSIRRGSVDCEGASGTSSTVSASFSASGKGVKGPELPASLEDQFPRHHEIPAAAAVTYLATVNSDFSKHQAFASFPKAIPSLPSAVRYSPQSNFIQERKS
jgi:hypothetical protein